MVGEERVVDIHPAVGHVPEPQTAGREVSFIFYYE